MPEPQRPAVGEADLGVGVEQGRGAHQGPGDEPVVGREQGRVVPVGPFQQAFVVGGDVALVALVDPHLDPGVGGREGARDVRGVVGRGVVDDQHPYVDAGLLVQDALDAVGQEVAVLVAGDHHADGAHWAATSVEPDAARPAGAVVVNTGPTQ